MTSPRRRSFDCNPRTLLCFALFLESAYTEFLTNERPTELAERQGGRCDSTPVWRHITSYTAGQSDSDGRGGDSDNDEEGENRKTSSSSSFNRRMCAVHNNKVYAAAADYERRENLQSKCKVNCTKARHSA